MESLFLQSPIPQKTISSVLLFVLCINMLFMFVLIPTKEARAIPVEVIKDVITSLWEGIKQVYRTIDTALQDLQGVFSGITAGWAIWDKANSIAEDLITLAIQQLLYRILAMVTNDIIKWINGGGEPRFVQDWGAFLQEAVDQAGGDFLSRLGAGFLCQPFAFQLRIALAPVSYYQAARCTLSDMGRNMQNFFNNFSAGGGWGTWLSVIQPQNNFYGSYLMAMDEKNREEAMEREKRLNEAMSGSGFIGAKKCVSGGLIDFDSGNMVETCSGATACEEMKKNMEGVSGRYEFKCTSEQIATPPSVLSNEINQAIDSGRALLQQQIAELTPELDIFGINLAPFFSAILSSVINRVIGEGLGALGGLMSPDASASNNYGNYYYNQYMQGQDFLPTDNFQLATQSSPVSQAQAILASSPLLGRAQTLLLENLETQLLSQQQRNLDVLNSIKDIQVQTLNVLKDMVANDCSLPYWVSSQIISESGSQQIIKLTASGIGEITIKKTTATTDIGSSISVEVQETKPYAQQQINTLNQEIVATNQWISDTKDAIKSNNDALAKAQEFQDFYQGNTGVFQTEADTKKYDDLGKELTAAYNVAMILSKRAAQSNDDDLNLLVAATNNKSVEAIQKGYTYESIRTDTLSPQQSSISSRPSEASSALQTCQQENL